MAIRTSSGGRGLWPQTDLELDSLLGHAASVSVEGSTSLLHPARRTWTGICASIELVGVEPSGLSTYALTLVPRLWLLSQRTHHRLFQHQSIPAIVDQLLDEWAVARTVRLERDAYPALELRVQYGESDYAFVCRLLEESGISFFFDHDPDHGSLLVLADAPHRRKARNDGVPLPFVDEPALAQAAQKEYLTAVRFSHALRPGATRRRDTDFRHPQRSLEASATLKPGPEARLEQVRYAPGAFLVEGAASDKTPVADDQGTARASEAFGQTLAARQLQSLRAERRLA